MTTSTDPGPHHIQTAHALLTAVAHNPTEPAPGVVIHCLHATDHLRLAGAQTSNMPDTDTDSGAERGHGDVIRHALHELAELPPAVFARHHVVEAAAAARRALERCDDP